MATKLAASIKDTIYNGTHGNLSVALGSLPKEASAANDVIQLLKLDAGVKLVDFAIVVKAAATSSTAKYQVQIVPQGKTAVDVGGQLTLATTGEEVKADGWFPEELYDVPCTVQVVVKGATKAGDVHHFKAYTTSVGSL
ncbi:hypothetical protein [Vibrio harveyi]|uniref:hypothetical protein n=1 Tax=Vibrio harveyi TaxID=669 RepID=UPI0025AFE000|nr:hypothetical protein [Vibrio harveyi]WJT09279.1 hypothetical protein PH545_24955 [Vibrio harveyi]